MDVHGLLIQGLQQGGAGVPQMGGGGVLHLAQGPAEVHRRGAGGVQLGGVGLELGLEGGGVRRADGAGQDVEAVSGADADGGRAPDPERLDGLHHLLHRLEAELPFLIREQALVDDIEGLGGLVVADVLGVGNGFQGGGHGNAPFFHGGSLRFPDCSINHAFLQRLRGWGDVLPRMLKEETRRLVLTGERLPGERSGG